MRRNKPPVIVGRIPDQQYDLDDDSQLQSLGLSPDVGLKIADEYDHYPECKWAIVEYKSRSLRNSVDQLEDTAEQIFKIQRAVDLVIIVAERINRAERHIFQKRGNMLYNKLRKTPVQIRAGNKRIEVNIYEAHEVDRQYKKYKGSLIPWVSK